ncbi:hypothetical protein SmJEL517_g06067 [Synchytrium microbalum]|uniref:Uncharacterized protein n=1 Tax=Synchytrium microbalum TaxID=1806994 RepID=A0A507BHP3_9FUNG|nr:uncharacterized protein SmJEL517_g06067 [Synchytrium microbalum]TPX30370.1 hypothetical protein SmJEL517_g06067 [Synchytrium microbalum]
MAIDAPQGGKAASSREVNVVADDAIWFELSSAKNWERSWGFMRETLRSPTPNNTTTVKLPPIASTSPHASGLPSKLPCGLATNAEPVLADLMYAHKIKRVITSKTPQEKYTFPPSTSSEYGWSRETIKTGNPLEIYPNQVKGRGNIMHWLMT